MEQKRLEAFDYEIVRSDRKTLSIEVHHQKVKVRAPKKAPEDWIESFVYQKAKWIARKLVEQAKRDESRLKLIDGQVIHYLGQDRVISVISGPNRITLSNNSLIIQNKELTDESLSKQLDRWLLTQAKAILPSKVEALAEHMGLQRKLSGIRFRKTKTQWGHCTRQGVVQLNQLILLTPMFVIDYLIIHELSHLKHLNHSKRFWSLVQKYCPDYQRAELWLKQHGHSVWY
ncbi:M48 family metallopeptidase [Kangiella taiwanensis]|uniref:SprT family zinc-dependent metalloprotease n=1 Tax=Kangiella taiwanensis TaxID=1079179 RepID=A0ABP8I5W9_9GAMM|nr:SprT family zinc-dependent metalloprotease [Kangiella taiwanensis]